MQFEGMVDLARTPKEANEDRAAQAAPVSPQITEPLYPWGMCLRLEEEVLEKLGYEGELPGVGEVVHLTALGKVTSARASEDLQPDGSKKVCRCVEIQITHLAADDLEREPSVEEREAADKARSNAFYVDDDGDDE